MAICVSFYLLIMHLDPDLMVSVDAKHHVYLLDPDLSAVMTVLEWWSVLRCLVTDRNCRFSVVDYLPGMCYRRVRYDSGGQYGTVL